MITRLSATLESITRGTIPIATLLPAPSIALEALIPVYLADALEPKLNTPITLHTRTLLEGQGQGTSFIPRIIGFGSAQERAFFETFTSVKGVGTRKALRALIEEPSTIASMIIAKDAKALTKLPEIGKRTAETIIAELTGKIEQFAGDAIMSGFTQSTTVIEPTFASGPAAEAVSALMSLGETRPDASRKVEIVLSRIGPDADTDTIVQAVFAGG
ncbi:MAG: Holliday junction branch migration protein RuvA [Phycisphaerales bacterium]